MKLVPHSEIQKLGLPLGDDGFVSEFVIKKLLGRLSETVEKLVGFEDTQAATYLLRVSYSIVRAVHFMRTTPLGQWKKEGEEFDEMVCDAAGRILGHPLTRARLHRLPSRPNLEAWVCASQSNMLTLPTVQAGTSLVSSLVKHGSGLLKLARFTCVSRKRHTTSTRRCISIWLTLLQMSVRSSACFVSRAHMLAPTLLLFPRRRTAKIVF